MQTTKKDIIPLSLEKTWHQDAFLVILSFSEPRKEKEIYYNCNHCGSSAKAIPTLREKSKKCFKKFTS